MPKAKTPRPMNAREIRIQEAREIRIQEARDEREKWLKELRGHLPPGATAFTRVTYAARSGMSRCITVHVPGTDHRGEPTILDLTWMVSRVTGDKIHRDHGGIIMGGCGMDMGFALVYNLSRALYPSGFPCIGENCASNDHFNGERDRTPHGAIIPGPRCSGDDPEPCWCHDPGHPPYREGLNGCPSCGCRVADHWHGGDGGYAIRQRWL